MNFNHQLSENYRQLLVSKAVRELARRGVYPTKDAIQEYVDENLFGITLGRPRSSAVKPAIGDGTALSATAFNKYFEALKDDLDVAFKTIYTNFSYAQYLYGRANSGLQSVRRRSKKLLTKAGSLEAALGTGGISISDSFSDVNNIDLAETTARIDVKNGLVSSNFDLLPWGSPLSISMSFLEPDRIVDIRSDDLSNIDNLLLDGVTGWHATITSEQPDPISIEIVLELDLQGIEIGAVEITGAQSSPLNPLVAQLSYSQDGINYNQLTNRTIIEGSGLEFLEDNVYAKYLKIGLTKLFADSNVNGLYEFSFILEQLRVFWVDRNQQAKTSILVTEELTPSTNSFSSVRLQVCENKPANSSIKYLISFKEEDGTYTRWNEIAPLNTDSSTSVIELGQANSLMFRGLRAGRITENQLSVDESNYSLLSNEGAFSVPNDITSSEIFLWRNVLSSNQISYPGIPGSSLGGWYFDGNMYQTWLNVVRDTILSAGSYQIIVDQRMYTGDVVLTPGRHQVSIYAANFMGNARHKESVSALVGTGAVDLQAGILATKVSKDRFLYQTESNIYDKFALDFIGESQSVFVKSSPTLTEELFAFECNTRVTANATALKLKAEFYSDGNAIPTLSGYNLILGK
jgi:hypothetical protein